MEPFIRVEHLHKHFIVRKKREKGAFLREKEVFHALKGVSFSIHAGEMVGYIGPNGAGKSTTIKLLSGILTPDGGKVLIDGRVPHIERKAHVKNIGVVFGQRTQLWWDVPVIESYDLLKDIFNVEKSAYRRRLEELTETLELSPLLHTPLRLLSLGQRMRVEVAASLLHSPKLLFLDEPTIGLDAVSKLSLRAFLQHENRTHNTTILLTTHDMEDIRALCPRVMVIGRGEMLYDGALKDLLSRYDTVRIAKVRYVEHISPMLPTCCDVSANGEEFTITCPHEHLSAGEFVNALQSTGTIAEMTITSQSLDAMISSMYREMAL